MVDYASLLNQTYNDTLGRAPDQGGMNYWSNMLSTGQVTPDQLASLFAASPEGLQYSSRATGTTAAPSGSGAATGVGSGAAQDFGSLLNTTYQTELGRAPDAGGLQYWSNMLSTGQVSPSDLSRLFSESAEGLSYDQRAGSAGDMGGQDAGTGDGSATFTTLPGTGAGADGLGFSDQITKYYQDELYRAPDVAGLQYWLGLANKGVPMADILAGIAASPEAIVQDSYNSTLGRSGEMEGVQYWMDRYAQGDLTYEQLQAAMRAAGAANNETVIGGDGGGGTDGGGGAGDPYTPGMGRTFTPAEMETYLTYGQRPEHRFYAPSGTTKTTT